MDEEQQDDIPPELVELGEIQAQAKAAREQDVAERALEAPPEAAGLIQNLEDIPAPKQVMVELEKAPEGRGAGQAVVDAPEGRKGGQVVVDAPEGQEADQAVVDAPEAAPVKQEAVAAPEPQTIQQQFTGIVEGMMQQAGAVQQALGIGDLMAPVPKQEFAQPERGKGERYVAYRNRVRELRKQHNAQPPAQEEFAINAIPPKLVPAADIAQQAQAAREVNAPPGNVARGDGAAAAAPGGRVALDLNPPDLERLTREGEDTADQLVERFRQFIEQTRRFNHALLAMLDSATAAMAQDHALLEQIRSRFERTREG
jgi:hypothetical protein